MAGATSRSRALATAADALTAARSIAALVAFPLISSRNWTMVALLFSLVWLSDLLDGRLARLSSGQTRLGDFDLLVDTVFGAGVVISLTAAGVIPFALGAGAMIVFGGLFLAGNTAAAMLLQLTGFIPVMAILWQERPQTWWAPFLVAALAAVVDWRRLIQVNIPAFLRGITGRFEHRRA